MAAKTHTTVIFSREEFFALIESINTTLTSLEETDTPENHALAPALYAKIPMLVALLDRLADICEKEFDVEVDMVYGIMDDSEEKED